MKALKTLGAGVLLLSLYALMGWLVITAIMETGP